MNLRSTVILIIAIFFVTSCGTTHNHQAFKPLGDRISKQIVVYKTFKNYSAYVPVILNDEGTKIISYPAPEDLIVDGKLSTPIKLKKGFWLDKRGVTKNTAFTNYTYENYSKLAEAPSLNNLFAAIIDKHPIKEIYNCTTAVSNNENIVDELNLMITKNKLSNCICIKK